MTAPEIHALQHAYTACLAHEEALREAFHDLDQRSLTAADLERLSREDRRLLDQFAYRYTRLQYDMGARLMPAALRAMGEEIAAMPMLDRLNRLEQLGWLPSAEGWLDLRRIRNEFAHDYPGTPQERFDRFQLALDAACKGLDILANITRKIGQRFPEMRP